MKSEEYMMDGALHIALTHDDKPSTTTTAEELKVIKTWSNAHLK